MKKIFTLLALLFFLSMQSGSAGNFVVSGAPYSWENGTYAEAGTYNSKPYYVFSSYYYIAWSGTQWELGEGCCGGSIDMADCYNTHTDATCPTSGWSCSNLVVAPETDNLTYNTHTFIESVANDGSFTSTVTISLKAISSGQAFTGANGDGYDGSKVIFGTLPYGLAPHITKTDTFVTLVFTGAASNNHHADDYWLTIQFTDAAFVNGPASGVAHSVDSIHLVYRDMHTVASSGADFTTVAGALAAASDYDIISISGETFTEYGLNVDKAVIIEGQGAKQTIIQANEFQGGVQERVFNVTANDTVEFHDLAIINGEAVSGNGEGGGIFSQSTPLNIYNCYFLANEAASTGAGSAFGGAIYCPAYLKIEGTTFLGNSAESSYGSGYGGAIFCYSLYMVNCTVAENSGSGGNDATNYGGGIFTNGGKSAFINCTVAYNSAEAGAGLCTYNGPQVNVINSIFYGNVNSGGINVYNNSGGVLNVSNSIIDAGSTVAINGTNYNVSSNDPLLAYPDDNGGPTQTAAIGLGSWAIDNGAIGNDSVPTTDQRGYAAYGVRNIGAFEYGGVITATKPVSAVENVQVYPNPANNFIIAETNLVNTAYTISDLLGQTVITGTLATRHAVINISRLSAGVYIFKAGGQQFKVVKE